MESHNPYSVGNARLATPAEHFEGEVAGKGRRFGTMLIDYVIYYLICIVLFIIAMMTLGEQSIEGINAYIISIPAFFAYYAGFEATLGRTPGKFICGTRVVTNDGGEPTYREALGRTLCRLIPFEPFSVLFTSEGIGWHDSIARTKVIRVR